MRHGQARREEVGGRRGAPVRCSVGGARGRRRAWGCGLSAELASRGRARWPHAGLARAGAASHLRASTAELAAGCGEERGLVMERTYWFGEPNVCNERLVGLLSDNRWACFQVCCKLRTTHFRFCSLSLVINLIMGLPT
jgi:hypothetical protein